jgi:hypothetical protein
LLALDGWLFLPIAYLSITDEPKRCQQLVLSFIGKFVSMEVPNHLPWLESEAVRFARRLLRSFSPKELAEHLGITDRHARRVLKNLVDLQILFVASGKTRYRMYGLRTE